MEMNRRTDAVKDALRTFRVIAVHRAADKPKTDVVIFLVRPGRVGLLA